VVKTALKAFVGMESSSMSNIVSDDVRHRLEALEAMVSAINLDALKSEILQDVGLLIANIPSDQAVVNPAIATPEIRHNQLDLTDISEVENLGTLVPVLDSKNNPDAHPYPIGSEIRLKELSEYLGFNLINYSTYAKKQGISSDEYINQKAIAKGERWEIATIGVKKIATRFS